jgi:hypothetical protein
MMDLGNHPRARTTGFVHLLYFLVGSAGSALTRGIVSGDAAATVKNLLAHESLYRSGVEVGILANAVYIVLTALFYVLFEPVSRRVSLIAAFFGVAGCAVQLFGTVFQAAPLLLLDGASTAGSIATGSMPAAVRLALKLYSETYDVSLVLFALFDVSIGWLVFKSRFLPRILGVAMMLAGLGAATFLWPPFARAHLAVILPLGGIAELALMLWLIVKGVDGTKWREAQARAQ